MKLISRKTITVLLFVVVALATYGQSLTNGFVDFDDTRLILNNPLIREISIHNFITIFSSYEAVLYTPLLMVSFMIDYFIEGLSPFMFHLHSLALHIITSLLVMKLMIMITKNKMASVFVGLLFLVHPLNTEVVAWASARKDLLAGAFSLLTIITYLHSRKIDDKRFLFGSIFLFALALLSKPSVLFVPLILPLLYLYQRDKTSFGFKKELPLVLPHITLSTFALIIGLFGNTQLTRMGEGSVIENTLLALKSSGMLILKFVIPTKFSVMYPYTDSISIFSHHIFLPAILLILVLMIGIYLRKKAPSLITGIIIFLILLIPTFNSFRYGENFADIYFTADRYAYLPMIGLFIPVAVLFGIILNKYNKLKIVPVGIILLFGFLANAQAKTWENTQSLFENVVSKYPNAQMAHTNIGKIYEERGLREVAIREYEKSLSIRPNFRAYFNLANLQIITGDLSDASKNLEAAITLNSLHGPAHMQLGIVYRNMKQFENALNMFSTAQKIDPSSVEPLVQTGLVYELSDNIPEAISAYEKVLEKDENHIPVMQSLGLLYFEEGEKQRGIELVERVLILIPNDAATMEVLEYMRE